MGYNYAPVYGDAEVAAAMETIERAIAKIRTNKFDKKDLLGLHNANAELIKALLSNDYKD